MSNTIKLVKAFRTDATTVKVLYLHTELRYEFVIEHNSMHAETGSVGDYVLQVDCLSSSGAFNALIKSAIAGGESDDNDYIDVYLALRDTFDSVNCAEL